MLSSSTHAVTTGLLRNSSCKSSNLISLPRRVNSSTATTPVATTTPATATTKAAKSSFSFLEWYVNKLDTHPLLTKSITSAIIAGMGDVGCQYVTKNDDEGIDIPRTGRFFVLGGVIVGPFVHMWYGLLAQYLPGTSVKTVIQRVALDQFVFTPFCLPLWLTSLWTLEASPTVLAKKQENPPTGSMLQRLQQEAPSIIQANWTFWIPVMCVNFGFVPYKFQVLFSNVASLVWSGYLSFTTSSSSTLKEVIEHPEESHRD